MACVFSISTLGQAYSDLQAINKLLLTSKTDTSKLRIAELLVPYFNISSPVALHQLKKVLPPDIYGAIDYYVKINTENFGKIESFKNYDVTIDSNFKKLNNALLRLNNLLKRESNKMYGLNPNMTIATVSLTYHNAALDSGLNKLSANERMMGLDVAFDDPTIIALKMELQIPTNMVSAKVRDTIEYINMQLTTIQEAKIDILTAVNNNPSLFNKLIGPGDKSIKAADYKSLIKNFGDQPMFLPTTVSPATISATYGMPSQAEMIDALVIYISKRFSQEVAISFIEVLKKRAKNIQLISEMFPQTLKILMEGSTYEVPRLGGVWHNAIAEDLYNLPFNLRGSKYIFDKLKFASTENYLMFQDAVTIGELARKGSSLPEIVMLYKSKSNLIKLNSPVVKTSFEYINLINNELTFPASVSSSKYWLDWHTLNNLEKKDWKLLMVMLGCRYENEIFGKTGLDLNIVEIEDDIRWEIFRSNLQKSLLVLNQFQDRRIAASTMPISGNFSSVKLISFWECQQQLFNILLDSNLNIQYKEIATKVAFINRGMQIYKLTEEKNYALMLRECIKMVEEILPERTARLNELITKQWQLSKGQYAKQSKNINSVIDPFNDLYGGLSKLDILDTSFNSSAKKMIWDYSVKYKIPLGISKDNREAMKCLTDHFYSQLILATENHQRKFLELRGDLAVEKLMYSVINPGENNRSFANTTRSANSMVVILKTGEFFTDVLSARDNKQLSKVIESYAMPPSSYKIKRNTRYSVDLDAYVGIYGGFESLGSATPDSIKRIAPVWGLSAPIGISFSWGSSKPTGPNEEASFLKSNGQPRTLSGNNFSFTISVIDIAAPLAYRWSNDTEDALPKSLRWSQLFSPGLHLRWGIKNTPLCFSTGIQYTPQLRKIDQASSSQQAYRAYAGVFFDLPLYSLYKR